MSRRTTNMRQSVWGALPWVNRRSVNAAPVNTDLAPQRRHLPAQAGTKSDRVDADAVTRLENENAHYAIVKGLWRYHKLMPPLQDSPWRQRFEAFLQWLVLYNCLMIPMQIAFFWGLRSLPNGAYAYEVLEGIELAVDILFWIDIPLSARTAYYDTSLGVVNDLVVDSSLIMRGYGRYWLWMDLTATIPWNLIFGSTLLGPYLKLVRLLRISRVWKVQVEDVGAPTTGRRFLKITGLILLFCHWIACLWWWIGTASWNLTADFGHSWIFRHAELPTCETLPDTPEYEAAAEAALVALTGTAMGADLSAAHLEVLRHSWRYAWCDDGAGGLKHDFKLYLGDLASVGDPAAGGGGAPLVLDAALLGQQYLSSFYWSLTMMMKTPYVGPDTVYEKAIAW